MKVKRIRKDEIEAQLFRDPQTDNINRRLGEMRNNANALKNLIRERPQRKDIIVAALDSFKLELEAAAATSK